MSPTEAVSKKDVSFWTRLMHAAIEGRLPHLRTLPAPDYVDMKSFVYTALLYKNSLAGLRIFGDDNLSGFWTICSRMGEFKKIQWCLDFDLVSYTYLTRFDDMIEKCPHVKQISFDVRFDAKQQTNEPEPMIIHDVRCDWRLISTDSQLE